MSAPTGARGLPADDGDRESGIHPTARCLDAGEDLRAALLRLCESEAPRAEIWPIALVPRKASSKRARRLLPKV